MSTKSAIEIFQANVIRLLDERAAVWSEIARRVGMEPKAFWAMLRNKNRKTLDPDVVVRLASELDRPVEYFFTEHEEAKKRIDDAEVKVWPKRMGGAK